MPNMNSGTERPYAPLLEPYTTLDPKRIAEEFNS